MKVLITTSGLGNRLGNITKYTNKSLVRLGKLPALSHILNSYPKDTEFVITVGYYGNHVREYIKLAHTDLNVKFVNVDKFEGPGSSLLYSMTSAKTHLQSEFIFHACDSVTQNPIKFGEGNICISSQKDDNSQYRTLNVSDNTIINIEEKGSLSSNNIHIGIVKIKDYEKFWEIAESLLSDYPTDTTLVDCHVINKLIESKIPFKNQSINDWYDIGNSKALNDAKKIFENDFKILDKDEENIFLFPDFVIKFFYDKTIVKNRVNRLKHLKNYGPTLIDYTDNFYKYKFVEGQLASDNVDATLFYNLLTDLQSNFWNEVSSNDTFYDKTRKFYFDKTKERVSMFYKSVGHKYENININGLKIDKFEDLISKIPENLLCTNKKCYFHGDFILDNLIIKDGVFKFLDWRQDFCGEIDGGDVYYDLAKMNHSLYFDHHLITNNNFKSEECENYVNIELLCKFSSIEKREKFKQFIKNHGYNETKINILTSIIWLNMSPLHIYPLNKFLYFLGIYTLQKQLNEL